MDWNLSEIAEITKGQLVGQNVSIHGVSTDTRTLSAGDLFVAIKGENYDANQFLATAKSKGAAAVMTNSRTAIPAGMPGTVIEDARLALADMAAAWRRRYTLPLIGITGSNGKTTTKEMVAKMLAAAYGDQVLATKGNLNNDIGLPMTLLQLTAEHRAAVIEMGMNHPGEIALLAQIAAPTVALVTNAMRAHLLGLGSVHRVAHEKGQIYNALADDGCAVINAASPFAAMWRDIAGARRVVTYALNAAADIEGTADMHGFATKLRINVCGQQIAVDLAIPGMHNAENALAATACAVAVGVPVASIAQGLADFKGITGRLQFKRAKQGASILDDTYNANPDSFRAGIDVLAKAIGCKILVMGDMGETGEGTAQYHDEIGGYAKSHGIDYLLTLGQYAELAARNFGQGGESFSSVESMVKKLQSILTKEATVLIKGSRFMKMERIVAAIVDKESAAC